MGNNFEKEIAEIRKGIELAKRLREQALARKELLENQLQEIESEIRRLGVEPERLEEELARLEKEIARAIAEARELIPWDLIEKYSAGGNERRGRED